MSRYDDGSSSGSISPWAWVGGVVGVFFLLWLFIFGISWIGARATPQAGQIGVVRNGPSAVWIGSWFNGHNVRGVVAPGSGSTYIGLGSTVHYYPDSSVQRQYTISSIANQGDRAGVDFVQVPTQDGVDVTLNGSFYFTTKFDASPQGKASTIAFDNRFGIRTFPVPGTSSELYPWEGTDGWAAFLNSVVRPIIDNDLRKAVGSVTCEQLVASCALVHNANALQGVKTTGVGNQATIQAIQTQINSSLEQDIANTLGQDYFSNVQFLLGSVQLPGAVQGEIDNAQAQYAAVATATAQKVQAQQQSEANQIRQQGYASCPACAAIDELKAIPSNVTTFAPGAGFAITAK